MRSTRGPGGGYLLGEKMFETRVSDIILAVDEPIKVTRCQPGSGKGCQNKISGRCLTHDLWQGLGAQIHNYLSSVTLADISNNDFDGAAGIKIMKPCASDSAVGMA